jgi:hypothetical protein
VKREISALAQQAALSTVSRGTASAPTDLTLHARNHGHQQQALLRRRYEFRLRHAEAEVDGGPHDAASAPGGLSAD